MNNPRNCTPQAVKQAEALISNLLRYGVVLSLTIVLGGIVVSFVHHPDYLTLGQGFAGLNGSAQTSDTLRQVGQGLLTGHGQAIVAVGLLLLVATPVARVALSLVLFARMSDWRFIGITAVVLTLLMLSFALGAATEGSLPTP